MKLLVKAALMLVILASTFTVNAQNLQSAQKQVNNKGVMKYAKFSADQNLSVSQAKTLLEHELKANGTNKLTQISQKQDDLGFTNTRYQQEYQNLPVEFHTYMIHAKNNAVTVMNGNFLAIEKLNTTPALNETAALDKAMAFINADIYMWETEEPQMQRAAMTEYFPKGELVVMEDLMGDHQPVLAYKFDIYAEQPLSSDDVYVNAHTGKIVFKNAIIKQCFNAAHKHNTEAVCVEEHINTLETLLASGTAATRYSGNRSIETSTTSGGYHLRESTRGGGIETYNCNQSTRYNRASDFVDNDNNWTAGEWNNTAKNNAALDAHWGAEMTYDYFLNTHNRDSYDGNGATIKNYVHYNRNYDNAFWDGSRMTYGDGSTFDALTSLDVAAHEIGHGICSNSANLVYSYESGAMNEAFSDIWAACVEAFAAPEKDIWLVGEDIGQSYGPLRSMSNPNSKSHPDTYLGDHWYAGSGDNGGVHYNSGVLNHCFYLLTEGKNGTNDIGDQYSVSGIGIADAGAIFYRLETVYLSSNSQYADARTFGIQSAVDIFGAGSAQEESVTNAFYAVGIGAEYGGGSPTEPTCNDGIMNGDETGVDCGGSCTACEPTPPTSCDAPAGLSANSIKRNRATLSWSSVSGASSYVLEVQTAGGDWSGATTYSTSSTSRTLSGLSNGTTYEWRVKANCDSDASPYSVVCSWTSGNASSSACGTFTLGGVTAMDQLSIYPNPARNVLNLDIPTAEGTTFIQILDLYGKVVLSEVTNNTSVRLNIQSLAAGFYFVNVENSSTKTVEKIVIR